MCRIASLLLVTEAERKHVRRSARFQQHWDASCHQVPPFPLYPPPPRRQGKAPKEIYAILIEILGEHAPSFATVKNWVAQFKRGDFSTCDAPRPGRPKTVTTPEIIDQIHELILEDGWISAKSIAEQLGISRERVGSTTHEDLGIRKLSAKWVPKCLKADQKANDASRMSNSGIFSARSKWFPVGRDWWPWTKPGFITMTRRQSNNQWSGGIVAHPTQKNPECINPLEKFSPRFFGIKKASSSLIIFQRAKLSTRSITHLYWCNWRTFWRKNASESSSAGSCSCTTMPRLPGHLQPRRNWPTWASSVLITHTSLRIWSCRTTTCSLDWKTIERSPFFVRCGGHCYRGNLVGRTIFWSFFFFEWLAKVRAKG